MYKKELHFIFLFIFSFEFIPAQPLPKLLFQLVHNLSRTEGK